MVNGLAQMTFHNQTILIACSDKKDRLQFFNYFDELNADKIFTAADLSQMEEMLNSEEDYSILVFEISKKWFQNNQQIIKLKVEQPGLKLVGLIAPQVVLNNTQYQELRTTIDYLLFSPVMQHELMAKCIAQQIQHDRHQLNNNLENYLNQVFQPSGLPQFLIDTNSQEVTHVNEAMVKNLDINANDLIGKVWYENLVEDQKIDIGKLTSNLTEKGFLESSLMIDFGSGSKPVNLHIHYTTIGDEPLYLAEVSDNTEQFFQKSFLGYLEKIYSLNFEDKSLKDEMKKMLEWANIDFCFVVGTNRNNSYKVIKWDCSLNNYAQKFISASHEFLLRKVNTDHVFEIDDSAYQIIPGDDFLNFYSVNSIIVCDSYVDEQNDAMLIAGSIKKPKHWDLIKLLFKQLSLHYRQKMAFKVLQKSHESESQYDVLTELLNRRYIVKAIEQSIENSDDFNAIMFLDLDRFKVINDSLGHDVGDDVLINIAKILKKHVNGYGVASRYAGDEFLILLNKNVNKEKTHSIAKKILESIANPIKLNNGSEINLTVSLGVSYYPDHGISVDKLIKHADIALYDAKLNGKNRFTVYDTDLDDDSSKQNEEMVKSLQSAIENDEIEVYYQPKINAKTEDIMGFEALVRWEHPELGIISPGLFIPLAEQSNLIDDIGMLVIEKSCLMLKKWQEQYNIPLNMSVNLSPIQLNDKNLTEKISSLINKTGIYPSNLDFEITESEKFKSAKDALVMFKKLVNLGCTLSIDDFGTGHSTLDYLRTIPAKTLKIDQVFVKNIGLSPDDEAILDATIDMAKRVGHDIVAEGVETEEQRIYLTQKGCDYFQGYLFCRPLPANEIERILSQRAEILKNN